MQLDSSSNNAYLSWSEDTDGDILPDEIYFTSLQSNGSFIISPFDLSNNSGISLESDIAADGDMVSVSWQDLVTAFTNSEILIKNSADAGLNFGGVTNISNTEFDSKEVKIAVSDGNIFAVWGEDLDGDFALLTDEIFFISSSDGGETFSGLKDISNTKVTDPFNPLGTSDQASIASSGDYAVVAWEEGDNISTNNINIRASNPSDVDISFDATQYGPGGAPMLKVVDSSSSGSVFVNISTDSGESISSFELIESDVPGVFTNSFTFSDSTTSSTLSAVPGDILTATYGSQETQAIFKPAGVGVEFSPFHTMFDRKEIAHVTVTDPSAAGSGSVIVHVNSQISGGFDLELTETSPGVFGNSENNQIVLLGPNSFYDISDYYDTIVNIEQEDSSQNNNDSTTQTISVIVSSTSNPVGLSLNLVETTPSSGVFAAPLSLTAYADSFESLYVKANDILNLKYGGSTINYGFVNPRTDQTIGGLEVRSFDAGDDLITVDYNGSTVSALVTNTSLGGGGGGGVSRAGLVVQAVGAISLFGGGNISGPPSFDDKVFTLKQDGTKLSGSGIFEVGTQSTISMGFRMPGGLNELDHVGLYANIASGKGKYDSDTYIYFDKYKTPQITIHDPQGFFKSVKVDVTEPSKSNLNVNFAFDFTKSIDNSNVVFEAWNIKRDSALKEIPGLLKVGDTTIETPSEPEIIHTQTEEKLPIPQWIKSNAAWWGKGAIDDKEFTNGIGYLIQKQIINVPELLQKNTSPNVGLMDSPEFVPVVPSWVKNNALWWSEGKLTDDDFIVGIKYLLEQNIIKVAV
jgi:hypothetical protein